MPVDSEKLGDLLDRYWPVLVAWVAGTRDDAEDIVQSAFIKLAAEDPAPINCAAWLFTVTKRLAMNEHLSRNKRRLREAEVASQRLKPVCSQKRSTALELEDLLSKLEKREREVVIARIWGGLTFDEIASVIGESKATVWRVYQSGIEALRDLYRREASE